MLSAVALAVQSAQAEMKPGSCPERSQNKPIETFNPYSMAGLWYEYVWEENFALDYGYVCSTWIVLSDEADKGPGKYQVYNNMVFGTEEIIDEETGEKVPDSAFIKFKMDWNEKTEAGQKAQASFLRKDEDDVEGQSPDLKINFIDTDYH